MFKASQGGGLKTISAEDQFMYMHGMEAEMPIADSLMAIMHHHLHLDLSNPQLELNISVSQIMVQCYLLTLVVFSVSLQ